VNATGERVEGRWPAGVRCMAAITVNFDAETLLLSQDPAFEDRQKSLSIMRYGAHRGAERLLETFAERDVPATWFLPGRVAETYPTVVRAVARAGHSIGTRGYALERFDSLSQQATTEALRRGRDAVSDVLGQPVRGFRLPSGNWPVPLAAQLLDCGFEWSSSWFGDDLPFHVPGPGNRGLLEIPVSYGLDDRIAFFWNFSPPMPVGQSRISSYSEALGNWIYELEGCQREGLCFVMQLHPEICGTPGRIRLVRDLLDAVRNSGGTEFATCDQIAGWWRDRHPANDPGHPVEVFRKALSSFRA
jgi:peptidoglycan/xylan/chitin deacetylase (PgdA/CDA1 family)